ncbi:Golgi transport complex subunit 3 [Diatrype stigma]|uniref:Conserved oligomeric Golgi complex subunit 3 n=1 Tax=Diatrype stigma TaxID=117547 RepID=A0AAN9YWT4_9PEZI
MYEDSWRRASLLQQPNGTKQSHTPEPLEDLYEEPPGSNDPPEPTLTRRAKSYSDFYHVVRAQLSKESAKKKRRKNNKGKTLDALLIEKPEDTIPHREAPQLKSLDRELLETSQREYLLYQDQLEITERHLDVLIEGADNALQLLASLADSFRAVESQTTSFQAQCDDLLTEEKRLRKLADEVGTDLHYYAYLDGVTRRLNAPGASRLVDHQNFAEILTNLDACIAFMVKHPTYRDAESYLARYQSLLTKALHLVEVGFANHLEHISSEIAKQIASTQSDSARHALAYGRFEQMVLEADGLIANVQRVIQSCYDDLGNPKAGQSFDYYSNTAINIFSCYSDVRDRDLRPITTHDLDVFRKEVKEASVETACRNFIKQCYERSFNEADLFAKIFSIETQYSTDDQSAYTVLKSHQKALVSAANITPVATTLQSALQTSELHTICNLLSWITNEWLLLEYEEDETRYALHCHGLTARLLTEHLWPLTDASFEAEVTKSISRAPISTESLNFTPVVNGVASSNAYPVTKRALELLAMYDEAMPKERSQKSSPVIYRIVNETILALQRVESRLSANKASVPDPDPDLFMIKNLLILKNSLVSLEIGDVRSHPAAMQHFGQIWDTLSPQNWMGLFRGILGGTLSLGLWSSSSSPAKGTPQQQAASVQAAAVAEQDANEKLDELLRKSIYAFTQRWGALINAAKGGRRGSAAKSLATMEKELDDKLATVFGGQPEVVSKLWEAIQMNAQAQSEVKDVKGGR